MYTPCYAIQDSVALKSLAEKKISLFISLFFVYFNYPFCYYYTIAIGRSWLKSGVINTTLFHVNRRRNMLIMKPFNRILGLAQSLESTEIESAH